MLLCAPHSTRLDSTGAWCNHDRLLCPSDSPGASHRLSQTHVLHHGWCSCRLYADLQNPGNAVDRRERLQSHIHNIYNDDHLLDSLPSWESSRADCTRLGGPASRSNNRITTPSIYARHPGTLLTLSHNLPSLEDPRPPQRLLASVSACANDAMTTVTAPNSPPDLSGSKSSKSSSYHSSSQLSCADGALADISNFEDIGLDDDAALEYDDPYASGPITGAKQQSRSVSNATVRQNSAPLLPSRELMGSKRPDFPSLHGQVQNVVSHRTSEATGALKSANSLKGYTSSSASSLTIPPKTRPGRSRSSSPAHRMPTSAASSYTSNSASIRTATTSPKPLGPTSRKESWQPTRKSAKELEAEYHDSDDELPDDAALWNVPMSPRPPQDRTSPGPASRNGSPERDMPLPSPGPTPLEHSISAPILPDGSFDMTQQQILPKTRPPPRTSSLGANFHHNNPTTTEFRSHFRDHRTKSWTLALSDLSEEAKHITEALEFHATEAERQYADKLQKGTRSSRPSLETSMRSAKAKSFVELPPLQKSNIMIDPLPPSKEKEKILSRTRPSWLPPKDPKEERKHLKEYQRMMAASVEAEKRREQKQTKLALDKDSTRETLDRIWDQYVFPDWQKTVSEHRTRELWWRGISPNVRGMVWERAVGNELALIPDTYRKALERAKQHKNRLSSLKASSELTAEDRRIKEWFEDIDRDVTVVWPELNLFQHGCPCHDNLVDLLEAYAMYRADVGYCFGVHTVAALILLQVPNTPSAFALLANTLNRRLALSFLTNDPTGTGRAYSLALQTLVYKFPRLHHYLFGSSSAVSTPQPNGKSSSAPPSRSPSPNPSYNTSPSESPLSRTLSLHPSEIFEPLFRTLFTNLLPVDHATRVWDCFVFEGDRILIRAATAVLGALEPVLFDTPGQDVLEQRELVRQCIGWGPYGRGKEGEKIERAFGDVDKFMRTVREAGRVENGKR